MKARIQKNCPFCKGKVTQRLGFAGVRLFECHQCGAMVSFNNKECNKNKAVALKYWNRRAEDDNLSAV